MERIALLLLLCTTACQARSVLLQERDFEKTSSGCQVSIDYQKGNLKEPQPLILTDDPRKPSFFYPNARKLLVIARNESIQLACSGNANHLDFLPGKKRIARATCVGSQSFFVDGKVYEFSKFKCATRNREWVMKSQSTCLGRHQRYDIGFNLDKYFLPLLEICRDESTLRSYYAKATIVKDIQGYQSMYPRPFWRFGPFYKGHQMNAYFKADKQLASLAKQLGSMELASNYIRSGQRYLNRGHYAAKADFVYGSQQDATFWHLNTAPQWSSFNAGNWMIAERNVRDLASRLRRNLDIYTGVHETMLLKDVNGVERPIYLHFNETHRAIPVPRFFWKVIHEPVSNRAVALIGLNDPYADKVTQDMFLCPDISTTYDFSWLTWQASNIEFGVSYVCSVKELRKSLPTVPEIDEIDLLV